MFPRYHRSTSADVSLVDFKMFLTFFPRHTLGTHLDFILGKLKKIIADTDNYRYITMNFSAIDKIFLMELTVTFPQK